MVVGKQSYSPFTRPPRHCSEVFNSDTALKHQLKNTTKIDYREFILEDNNHYDFI